MDSPPDGVVPLTVATADTVAARLSPAHRREIRELSGLSPRAALRLSLAASLLAYAVEDECGEPLFLIGVEPPGLLTGAAQVWMVGTDAMRAHARKILRCARWGLATAFLATGAERLEQYIPEWYGTGLRFALRLGFRRGEAGFTNGNGAVRHVVLARPSFFATDERRTHGHSLVH